MVETVGMELFCYHRDRLGSVTLREEPLETLVLHGPVRGGDDCPRPDGDTPAGSVHIVGLPDPDAAHAFAFDEPNYQAGVYRDVLRHLDPRPLRRHRGAQLAIWRAARMISEREPSVALGSGLAVRLAGGQAARSRGSGAGYVPQLPTHMAG